MNSRSWLRAVLALMCLGTVAVGCGSSSTKTTTSTTTPGSETPQNPTGRSGY